MENEEAEVVVPQEEEQPDETVNLSPEEIEELKQKASVSSQNFERAKKAEERARALEEELANRNLTELDDADPVMQKLSEFDKRFQRIEEEKDLAILEVKYPAIKDKRAEFDEYRTQYAGIKLESVAKLFLAEHDLLGEAPKRKGLEKAGGGARTVPKPGSMSGEEARNLRTSNYREYTKQIKEGKLKVT